MKECNKGHYFYEASKIMLTHGGYLSFHAKGGSMHPFVRNNDFITIEPIKKEDIRIGDVVFMHFPDGKIVVHRVIKKFKWKGKNQDILVSNGDSLPRYDDAIRSDYVLGRILSIKRNGRKIRFNTPWGRLRNLFIARISPYSRFIYPILRMIKKFLRYTHIISKRCESKKTL